MKTTDFSFHLTNFLTTYMSGQRNSSINTIKNYRDAFKLFLIFCKEEKNIIPEKLTISKITSQLIQDYYNWLQTSRGCSINSRNHRRTALNSFFGYLQIEAPEHMFLCQKILAIPKKKSPQTVVGFLTPQAMTDLLGMPNQLNKAERKELVILTLLYDTGARVSELCGIKIRDIRLEAPAIITLTGKGNKTRHVPIMKNTVTLLQQYLSDIGYGNLKSSDYPLFVNCHNAQYTRKGISYIISKYEKRANEQSIQLAEFKITPHIFRHSKAMHLYQAGIDLIYIRDILGHVDISTTEIYAKLDTERKRDALERAYPEITKSNLPDWNDDTDLIAKLTALV